MGWRSVRPVGLVGTRGLGSPIYWALSHHIKIRFYHWSYDYQWGEEKRGVRDREFGMKYTQLDFKWIANKDLLYSTWNSAQCYVAAWMGGEFGGGWIHVYVWLSPCAVHLK